MNIMIIAVIINRFVGCLSRIDAENMLKDLQDGVFLIRESDQRRGEYAVGLRWLIYVVCEWISSYLQSYFNKILSTILSYTK